MRTGYRISAVAGAAVLLSSLLLPVAVAGTPAASCRGHAATIIGTGGPDDITGTPQKDVVVAKSGGDFVRGLGGNDIICTNRGSDFVLGGGGADKLYLGRGGDGTNPGRGGDTVRGGKGNFDTLEFGGTPGPMTVDLSTGVVTGNGTDDVRKMEDVFGSMGDDSITGDGNSNGLFGLEGNDTIMGLGDFDFIAGNDGDDALDGGGDVDFLDHYYIQGDFLTPTLGGVNVNFEAGTVTGQGNDTVANFEGSDGTPGPDVFRGTGESEEFTQMYEGDDEVDSMGGADLVDGGDGNNDLNGGGGKDTVGHLDHNEDMTIDLAAKTATSASYSDTVTRFENAIGSFGNDSIWGTSKANLLSGAPGEDDLHGLGGRDDLLGDWPLLLGGEQLSDADTADGGARRDRCDAETETSCERDFPASLLRVSSGNQGYTRYNR